MPYWLAATRTNQASDIIQRFDPRFWTVDFARPTMASVVATAPDALRVDASFHDSAGLVGLIWESADRWDHPLLAYETRRDYSRLTLSFDWRSGGIIGLDAVNGPTLTIEGQDATGAAATWYVRLWNYATGTPEAAHVVLPFQTLMGGFALPGTPINPAAIDRMFISLVPPGYDGQGTALAAEAEGWAELSTIRCDGEGAGLAIGDIWVPPHGLSMATGYDDAYNQTPARLIRQIEQLGYRGFVNHYVGMSHFMRLAPADGRLEAVATGDVLATPARAWHNDFVARAVACGMTPILSQSFELLDQYCPAGWRQLGPDGAAALTGWVPPSALLSPAQPAAVGWLAATASAWVSLMVGQGIAPNLQLGESWWWVTADGHVCIHDPGALTALAPVTGPVEVTGALTADQLALLDRAGAVLATATGTILTAARAAAGSLPLTTYLLIYLPTVFAQTMPELARANCPVAWAAPAFDVIQIEDYDWATTGNAYDRGRAVALLRARLGYDAAREHYFAGFVPAAAQSALWRIIVGALAEEASAGRPANFVWALPQVARDGFTYFALPAAEEPAVQTFDDILFPLSIGLQASVAPEFSTDIVTGLSGEEWRNSEWSDARLNFDVGPGLRSQADLSELVAFFRARRGPAIAFRFRDPLDSQSAGVITPLDQLIGTGDGITTDFQLVKLYGSPPTPQVRPILLPVVGTVRVAVGGSETTAWSLTPGGIIRFASPPVSGATVTAGYQFDVPVRFLDDRLDVAALGQGMGEAPVKLIEVRDVL